MTTIRSAVLILMLGLPATRAAGQVTDSLTNAPLAWTVFDPQHWNRIAVSLPSRGDSGGVQVTLPQVRGRFVLVYGRALMPDFEDETVSWVRQVAGELNLYLSLVGSAEEAHHETRMDVFAARIGPLAPGKYQVHVIWKPVYGSRAMIDQLLYDEPVVVP
jgi:hypothetical protein